jgi:hypothetical protein
MHGMAMGLFQDQSAALGAIQDLVDAGFERYDISILEGGTLDSVFPGDMVEEEIRFLHDSFKAGTTVVAVRTDAGDRAIAVMEQRGATDVRQALERWRREGWGAFTSNAK